METEYKGDYNANAYQNPQRFYLYFNAASASTVTCYATPFLHRIRSDRVKVTLKSFTIVVESTSAAPAAFAQSGRLVILDKSVMNMGADVANNAILLPFSIGGRSGQVNHYMYQSSASDEIACSFRKDDLFSDGILKLSVTNLVSYGGQSTLDTILFIQGIVEVTEDFAEVM